MSTKYLSKTQPVLCSLADSWRQTFIAGFAVASLAVSGCGAEVADINPVISEKSEQALSALRVPGLVMGLQHNLNQTTSETIMFSANDGVADHREGGDINAPNHRGFEWWSLPDVANADPGSYTLPPGVVVALKHNKNQQSVAITAFGKDATKSGNFTNFNRQIGGDRGASAGIGYHWYESTGAGFTNYAGVGDLLPKYTVVGLKHSMNQSSKKLVWNGVTYDPCASSTAPSGFKRVIGGDRGAPSGQGFCWFEKTTGEEIAAIPTLNGAGSRSIYMGKSDIGSLDKDGDGLLDTWENAWAEHMKPYLIFDNHENALSANEPVTIYRVYPISTSQIKIVYEFLMRNDGGYTSGTCSGSNGHGGDTDTAEYTLDTSDGGRTWILKKILLSTAGINWPGNSRLEVFNRKNPIIYMSAGKHHEYLTRDNDGNDSPYSSILGFIQCNDNVNGLYSHFLAPTSDGRMVSNNVGEPDLHPVSFFAGPLPMFPLPGSTKEYYSVWDGKNFYSDTAGRISSKFATVVYPTLPNGCSHVPCRQGGPLAAGCFSEVSSICAADPFCCNQYWDAQCVNQVASGCQ